MTPQQYIKKVRAAEKKFLKNVEQLKKQYSLEVKRLIRDIEKRKISQLKASLKQ